MTNLTHSEQEHIDSLEKNKERIIESGIPERYCDVEPKEAEFWRKYCSYYIFGGVGCGKTRLAYAIFKKEIEDTCKDAIESFIKDDTKEYFIIKSHVKIYTLPKLLQRIRESFNGKIFDDRTEIEKLWGIDDNKTEIEKISNFKGVLILDDMGTEKSTDWMLETLYLIVNERYEKDLPTIFISNLSLKELSAKVGDRIASRIAEMCTIKKIEGEDRRLLCNE